MSKRLSHVARRQPTQPRHDDFRVMLMGIVVVVGIAAASRVILCSMLPMFHIATSCLHEETKKMNSNKKIIYCAIFLGKSISLSILPLYSFSRIAESMSNGCQLVSISNSHSLIERKCENEWRSCTLQSFLGWSFC